MRQGLLGVLALAAVLTVAGCAGGTSSSTTVIVTTTRTVVETRSVTVTTAPGPRSDEPTEVYVHFLRAGKVAAARRALPGSRDAEAGALRILIEGPNEEERRAGLRTGVPKGTALVGLTIASGLATPLLSEHFWASRAGLDARVGQVVYTLTQFPSVQAVRFPQLLGPALSRPQLEDVTPAIFIETPVVGERVESPIRVFGSANTFEANFTIRILDAGGAVLKETFVTATSGTGTRGTFDVRVPVGRGRSGPVTLVAFEPSAKDGTPLYTVRVPLELSR